MLTWWEVLLKVRQIGVLQGEARPFKAADLANAARFDASNEQRSQRIASAWLSKFYKWGYVTKEGSDTPEGKRWVRVFKLTKYGIERGEPGPKPEWKASEPS